MVDKGILTELYGHAFPPLGQIVDVTDTGMSTVEQALVEALQERLERVPPEECWIQNLTIRMVGYKGDHAQQSPIALHLQLSHGQWGRPAGQKYNVILQPTGHRIVPDVKVDGGTTTLYEDVWTVDVTAVD